MSMTEHTPLQPPISPREHKHVHGESKRKSGGANGIPALILNRPTRASSVNNRNPTWVDDEDDELSSESDESQDNTSAAGDQVDDNNRNGEFALEDLKAGFHANLDDDELVAKLLSSQEGNASGLKWLEARMDLSKRGQGLNRSANRDSQGVSMDSSVGEQTARRCDTARNNGDTHIITAADDKQNVAVLMQGFRAAFTRSNVSLSTPSRAGLSAVRVPFDASSAVQGVLKAAASQPHKEVVLCGGRECMDHLCICAPLRICAEPAGCLLSGGMTLDCGNEVGGGELRGLALKGGGGTVLAVVSGNWVVSGCTIEVSPVACGIKVGSGASCKVVECTVTGGLQGIHFLPGSSGKVEGCHFRLSDVGVKCGERTDVSVEACSFEDLKGAGVWHGDKADSTPARRGHSVENSPRRDIDMSRRWLDTPNGSSSRSSPKFISPLDPGSLDKKGVDSKEALHENKVRHESSNSVPPLFTTWQREASDKKIRCCAEAEVHTSVEGGDAITGLVNVLSPSKGLGGLASFGHTVGAEQVADAGHERQWDGDSNGLVGQGVPGAEDVASPEQTERNVRKASADARRSADVVGDEVNMNGKGNSSTEGSPEDRKEREAAVCDIREASIDHGHLGDEESGDLGGEASPSLVLPSSGSPCSPLSLVSWSAEATPPPARRGPSTARRQGSQKSLRDSKKAREDKSPDGSSPVGSAAAQGAAGQTDAATRVGADKSPTIKPYQSGMATRAGADAMPAIKPYQPSTPPTRIGADSIPHIKPYQLSSPPVVNGAASPQVHQSGWHVSPNHQQGINASPSLQQGTPNSAQQDKRRPHPKVETKSRGDSRGKQHKGESEQPKELSEVEKRLRELEQTVTELTGEVERKGQYIRMQMTDYMRTLGPMQDALEKIIKQHDTQVLALRGTIASLEAEQCDVEQKHAAQVDQLMQKFESLESELGAHKRSQAASRPLRTISSSDETKAALEQALTALADKTTELAMLQTAVEEANREFASMGAEKDRQISDRDQKIALLEAANVKAYTVLQAELKGAREKIAFLQHTNLEFAATEVELQEARVKIVQREQEINDLNEQLKGRKESLDEAMLRLTTSVSKICSLQAIIKEKDETITSMTREMPKTRQHTSFQEHTSETSQHYTATSPSSSARCVQRPASSPSAPTQQSRSRSPQSPSLTSPLTSRQGSPAASPPVSPPLRRRERATGDPEDVHPGRPSHISSFLRSSSPDVFRTPKFQTPSAHSSRPDSSVLLSPGVRRLGSAFGGMTPPKIPAHRVADPGIFARAASFGGTTPSFHGSPAASAPHSRVEHSTEPPKSVFRTPKGFDAQSGDVSAMPSPHSVMGSVANTPEAVSFVQAAHPRII